MQLEDLSVALTDFFTVVFVAQSALYDKLAEADDPQPEEILCIFFR